MQEGELLIGRGLKVWLPVPDFDLEKLATMLYGYYSLSYRLLYSTVLNGCLLIVLQEERVWYLIYKSTFQALTYLPLFSTVHLPASMQHKALACIIFIQYIHISLHPHISLPTQYRDIHYLVPTSRKVNLIELLHLTKQ